MVPNNLFTDFRGGEGLGRLDGPLLFTVPSSHLLPVDLFSPSSYVFSLPFHVLSTL